MSYKQLDIKKFAPNQSLSPYIDAYWSIRNVSDVDVQIPIVPDGCMDIIYQNGKIFCVGAMSEAILVGNKPNEYTFGARFKPSILPQLLHVNAYELRDKKLLLEDISSELFYMINFKEDDEAQKVVKLEKIFERCFEDVVFKQNIFKIIHLIQLHRGNVAMDFIEKHSNLSIRHIERLFQTLVGYSPKKFCNIVRFFTLFKEVIKNDISNFSYKAYEYGYCDQAHLNKEFKKFSNFSPKDEIMSIFYNTKE